MKSGRGPDITSCHLQDCAKCAAFCCISPTSKKKKRDFPHLFRFWSALILFPSIITVCICIMQPAFFCINYLDIMLNSWTSLAITCFSAGWQERIHALQGISHHTSMLWNCWLVPPWWVNHDTWNTINWETQEWGGLRTHAGDCSSSFHLVLQVVGVISSMKSSTQNSSW